jgi:hypothetical protein
MSHVYAELVIPTHVGLGAKSKPREYSLVTASHVCSTCSAILMSFVADLAAHYALYLPGELAKNLNMGWRRLSNSREKKELH